MAAKEIRFKDDARRALQRGLDTVANAECTTTGRKPAAWRSATRSRMVSHLSRDDTLVPPNFIISQFWLSAMGVSPDNDGNVCSLMVFILRS